MRPEGDSRRQRNKIAVLSSTLLLAAVFMTACSQSGPGPSPARANTPQSVPVTVSLAQQQDLPIYLTGLGSVTAYYSVNVKSRADGQLVDLTFREGEYAKKGDVLHLIGPRPCHRQRDQAQVDMCPPQ